MLVLVLVAAGMPTAVAPHDKCIDENHNVRCGPDTEPIVPVLECVKDGSVDRVVDCANTAVGKIVDAVRCFIDTAPSDYIGTCLPEPAL